MLLLHLRVNCSSRKSIVDTVETRSLPCHFVLFHIPTLTYPFRRFITQHQQASVAPRHRSHTYSHPYPPNTQPSDLIACERKRKPHCQPQKEQPVFQILHDIEFCLDELVCAAAEELYPCVIRENEFASSDLARFVNDGAELLE
jgi:hypothetical protein